jgi:hypothetical protein
MINNEFKGKVECFIHIDACKDFSCSICTMTQCPERKHSLTNKLAWNFENVLTNRQHGKPQV